MEREQTTISVVIPCYKAEHCIEACLDSLIADNYPGAEYVLVNDRSPDGTADVIRRYIEAHPGANIKYIENEVNLGAGETRNVGIRCAGGEYITFVDADDIVEKDFLSDINRAIVEHHCDCVVFDAAIKTSDKTTDMVMFYGGGFAGNENLPPRAALVYLKGCTCGKAYRASILRNNDVRFAPLKRNEDLVFTKTAISFCSSVYYIRKILYYYNQNENSLMHDDSLLDKNNAIRAYEMIRSRFEGRGFDEELNSIYAIEILYSTTMTCLRQNDDARGNYKAAVSKYRFKDKYYRGYAKKYRIILTLFKLGMFRVVAEMLARQKK